MTLKGIFGTRYKIYIYYIIYYSYPNYNNECLTLYRAIVKRHTTSLPLLHEIMKLIFIFNISYVTYDVHGNDICWVRI